MRPRGSWVSLSPWGLRPHFMETSYHLISVWWKSQTPKFSSRGSQKNREIRGVISVAAPGWPLFLLILRNCSTMAFLPALMSPYLGFGPVRTIEKWGENACWERQPNKPEGSTGWENVEQGSRARQAGPCRTYSRVWSLSQDQSEATEVF
jgi:hypothetical protein